jgi:hypothetical protein
MLTNHARPIAWKLAVWTLPFSMAAVGATALGAERAAYKYVDEKGNVVYSQTPPAAKDAKKVDISPASGGRSASPVIRNPYDDPNRYSNSQEQYLARKLEQEKRAEEARQKRIADLEAECNRNRGTDCKNPAALTLIESSRIPRTRY